MARILTLAFLAGFLTCQSLYSAEYFVDSENGSDSRNGTSPEQAWQSLAKVNRTELQPGDVVRFKKGGLWRGTLKPKSGAENRPVTYTAYGEGDKPRLYGSVKLGKCWVPAGESLWETQRDSAEWLGDKTAFITGKWSLHREQSAEGQLRNDDRNDRQNAEQSVFLQIDVKSSGTSRNHLQLINAPFSIEEEKVYGVKLRIESSQPFRLEQGSIRLMKSGVPYSGYGECIFFEVEAISENTVEYSACFKAAQTADDARLTVYFGNTVPAETELKLQISAPTVKTRSLGLGVDAGNLIFNGDAAGWKRWSRDELKNQGDYFYDPQTSQVVLFSKEDPDKVYRTIEAALRRHVVNMSGTSWCVFDGFDIRYGAAHGFGGSKTAHYIIRNCDLSWIGGGHQFTRPDGKPVRYGNAIEFWSDAHDHLVENNRIWEIYDAALTNQGDGVNVQKNIVYRGNDVWNCEYSFEYWNRGPESVTDNILVEKNTFRNAGYGWGHIQRPDPNGRHLMFYDNPAKTSNFRIVDNLFEKATESAIRLEAARGQEAPDHKGDGRAWANLIELNRNQYIEEAGKPVARWLGKDYDFETFQRETGKEKEGAFALPK